MILPRPAGSSRFILDICQPEGSVKLLGLAVDGDESDMRPRVERLTKAFRRKGVFATRTVVEASSYTDGVATGLQALQSAFFRPNILFLRAPEDATGREEVGALLRQARKTGVGAMVLSQHPKAGLGVNSAIHVWVRDPPTRDPEAAFGLNNLNLSLLMGYRLSRAWDSDLSLVCVVSSPSEVGATEEFLRELADIARLPRRTRFRVPVGTFPQVVSAAPLSDLGIFGMSAAPNFDLMREVTDLSRSSCLFVADSGRESARA